jgi:hypothetical protein
MCTWKDETPIVMYFGLKYWIQEANFFTQQICILCTTLHHVSYPGTKKIFPSEMREDGIGFGGPIENLKAAINNRKHCK